MVYTCLFSQFSNLCVAFALVVSLVVEVELGRLSTFLGYFRETRKKNAAIEREGIIYFEVEVVDERLLSSYLSNQCLPRSQEIYLSASLPASSSDAVARLSLEKQGIFLSSRAIPLSQDGTRPTENCIARRS